MGDIQRCTIPIVFNRCKTKKKNFYLNLNSYTQVAKNVYGRNATKKMYAELIQSNISHLKPITGQFKVTYIIYRDYKRKPVLFDLDNVGAIVSKYFMDAIVNAGIVVDDNYNYMKEVTIKYGGKGETRAEVELEEIKCGCYNG